MRGPSLVSDKNPVIGCRESVEGRQLGQGVPAHGDVAVLQRLGYLPDLTADVEHRDLHHDRCELEHPLDDFAVILGESVGVHAADVAEHPQQ